MNGVEHLRVYLCFVTVLAVLFGQASSAAAAQRKRPAKQTAKAAAQPPNELTKLRDSYIKTTQEYKDSLRRLLALYQAAEHKAEQRLAQSRELYKEGLLSQKQLDESEHADGRDDTGVDGSRHGN